VAPTEIIQSWLVRLLEMLVGGLPEAKTESETETETESETNSEIGRGSQLQLPIPHVPHPSVHGPDSVTNPSYQIPTPERLLAHDLSLEAARQVFQLVEKVPPSARDLADQARRAAASVSLNLAEGSGRAGRDRLQHHRIAYASVKETMAALAWKLARPR
jgi:hypothetical protein